MADSFFEMVKKWTVYDYNNPGIKAEIIIDMLISEFVCGIVAKGLGGDHDFILLAKEFPIKAFTGDKTPYHLDIIKDKEKPEKDRISSRNAKVDYLLFDRKKEVLYLTELKTTKESFDEKQLIQMLYTAKLGAAESFRFYEQVIKASKQKRKYGHQSEELRKKLEIEDFESGIKENWKIPCVYLTVGDLDEKTYGAAELKDNTHPFSIAGFGVKKDDRGQRIFFEDSGKDTVRIIDIKKHIDSGNKRWEDVKKILDAISAEKTENERK